MVANGLKNPHRAEVGRDISEAVLKHKADGGKPAVYWPHEEQITRLEAAYTKWDKKGGVWTAAAKKVREV